MSSTAKRRVMISLWRSARLRWRASERTWLVTSLTRSSSRDKSVVVCSRLRLRCFAGGRGTGPRRRPPRTAFLAAVVSRAGRRAGRRSCGSRSTTPLSAPSPVPRTRSWMSRRPAGRAGSGRSRSPLRDRRRVITTSWKGTGERPAVVASRSGATPPRRSRLFSRTSPGRSLLLHFSRHATCARAAPRVPSGRRQKHSTCRSHSGPTTAVTPVLKSISVWSANDLNPCNSSFRQLHLVRSPGSEGEDRRHAGRVQCRSQRRGLCRCLERAREQANAPITLHQQIRAESAPQPRVAETQGLRPIHVVRDHQRVRHLHHTSFTGAHEAFASQRVEERIRARAIVPCADNHFVPTHARRRRRRSPAKSSHPESEVSSCVIREK